MFYTRTVFATQISEFLFIRRAMISNNFSENNIIVVSKVSHFCFSCYFESNCIKIKQTAPTDCSRIALYFENSFQLATTVFCLINFKSMYGLWSLSFKFCLWSAPLFILKVCSLIHILDFISNRKNLMSHA